MQPGQTLCLLLPTDYDHVAKRRDLFARPESAVDRPYLVPGLILIS